jgi:hypothetical protein
VETAADSAVITADDKPCDVGHHRADLEPVAAALAALAREASRLKTVPSRSSRWSASVSARAPDQIDPRFYRNGLGHFASGITVITAMSPTAGRLQLHAISPSNASTTWPLIRCAGGFCVNVLADGYQQVSAAFALSGGDRFRGVPHRRLATAHFPTRRHLWQGRCPAAYLGPSTPRRYSPQQSWPVGVGRAR